LYGVVSVGQSVFNYTNNLVGSEQAYTNNGATYTSTNESYRFDGANDYWNSTDKILDQTTSFSIYMDFIPYTASYYFAHDTNTNAKRIQFRSFSGNLVFRYEDDAGANQDITQTISLGERQRVLLTYNASSGIQRMWVNGTQAGQRSSTAPTTTGSYEIDIGGFSTGSNYANMELFELRIWNETVTPDMMNDTTPSYYVPIKNFTNSVNEENITVTPNKYFSSTNTNVNTSQNLASTHYSHIAGFNAFDKISGANVSTFTVNTSSEGGTATNTTYLPSLYTTYGNFTAEFNLANYYQSFTSYEAVPQASSTQNFTVFNHKLDVSISTDVGSADNNTFNVTIYSVNHTYNEAGTTTNGTSRHNLSHGTYMVWINDTTHTLTNQTITLNEGNNLTNLTIQVLTSNTFNIFIRNETSNTQINNTATLFVIGSVNASNYTVTNGSILIEMLTPDSYELIYYEDADVPRSYFVTLSSQSFENITLYTIDEDISSFYVAKETDESGSACSNNTVSLLRYYTDINGYRTVEMARTDTLGQAVFRVVPNIINYKLSFTGDCGDFVSEPSKLIDTTNSYLVTQAQAYLYSLDNLPSVTRNLSYLNNTYTYSYTWNDPINLVSEVCLEVTRRANGTTTTVHNNCSSSSSGSLIYTIPAKWRNNTVFNAKGIIDTNTEFSSYYELGEQADFRNSFSIFGPTGLWIGLLIISTLIIFASANAALMMVTAAITFIALGWIGIFFVSKSTLIGVVVFAGIILYRRGKV
jgi:hypothetical protein